jgi:hypothetical protein
MGSPVTASVMATLQEVTGGSKMDVGMGAGRQRARVIGQKPVTVEQLEHACRFMKDLAEWRAVRSTTIPAPSGGIRVPPSGGQPAVAS